MITINKRKDMQKYFIPETNTYVFDDHVQFNFNVSVSSHINAYNIYALNINAHNIYALNIYAQNIYALNIYVRDYINAHAISYYAVCLAYKNITCTSIKGRRPNSKHFVLKDEIKEELNNE